MRVLVDEACGAESKSGLQNTPSMRFHGTFLTETRTVNEEADQRTLPPEVGVHPRDLLDQRLHFWRAHPRVVFGFDSTIASTVASTIAGTIPRCRQS